MSSQVSLETLSARFRRVRELSEELVDPLETEDFVVQTCADVSPMKWHLAHTSWFFETFVLQVYIPEYKSFHPKYSDLFNSYYNSVGAQFFRPNRGTLSRPTVKEVMTYREMITSQTIELLTSLSQEILHEVSARIELGINHEQQHQELMLTDLKHIFGQNPLLPSYVASDEWRSASYVQPQWREFDGGLISIGHSGDDFSFDNERPQHQVYLESFELCTELVSQGDFLEFMQAGGYENHALWLSDGWELVQNEQWQHPLYWQKTNHDDWQVMTLCGLKPLDRNSPVCHLSFFEADAYARWRGCRLPTEAEWEHASVQANGLPSSVGTLLEDKIFHPVGKRSKDESMLNHMYGEVWEWTSSAYTAYPGYQPGTGALGEYNGKFMNAQRVLRGGSCVTSNDHLRTSYRNFFQPEKRWQFSGLRLARGKNR
ncbi:MAG: ergothioneine biosynthesis protein EgtB [Myxococcota bacterium]|nr:ergothioneine biosynthesis protein EgtB [Myxococcota bacterium]